jgi:hypothetical protein
MFELWRGFCLSIGKSQQFAVPVNQSLSFANHQLLPNSGIIHIGLDSQYGIIRMNGEYATLGLENRS